MSTTTNNKSAALFRAANLRLLDYPFSEALESALSICDEAVVIIGQSEDDTVSWVSSEMLKWEGRVRIAQTIFYYDLMWQEKWWTLAESLTDADWLMYADADEVYHQDDVPRIKEMMEKPDVWLINVPCVHFYMTPRWQRGFFGRATKFGRRSRGFRMRNWRSKERPHAPACMMVYSPHGGPEENAHDFRKPHAAVMQTPMYHYSWVRHAQALGYSLDKHVDWYADGKKHNLVEGHVPHDREPHNFLGEIDGLIEDELVWETEITDHPVVIDNWLAQHAVAYAELEESYDGIPGES